MEELKTIVPELYKDYSDLLSVGQIKRAAQLSKDIFEFTGKLFYLSHTGEPHYPTRNFDAKTVFVHLNPGSGAGNFSSMEDYLSRKCHKYCLFETYGVPIDASLDQVIEGYINKWEKYAYNRYVVEKKKDNFDYKQACFLLHWEDSGIELKNGNLKDDEIQRVNTVNIINQKLQLELFPYASNKIDTSLVGKIFKKKPELFLPYIERLFDFICLHPRKYVLFGSSLFANLFETYDKNINKIIEFKGNKQVYTDITTNNLGFSFYCINWKGKSFNVGIAHSFPRQDLPNAYDKMADYGRKCAEFYLSQEKILKK